MLDELRILIETDYHESAIEVQWEVQRESPLVWADRYGLIQVFLNLAKNSRRAMASTAVKRLRIAAREEDGTVVIRFEDTGTGVASPENLFQPFQRGAQSSGLGLYVSRAIMRSFGGDLQLRAEIGRLLLRCSLAPACSGRRGSECLNRRKRQFRFC